MATRNFIEREQPQMPLPDSEKRLKLHLLVFPVLYRHSEYQLEGRARRSAPANTKAKDKSPQGANLNPHIVNPSPSLRGVRMG